MDQAADPLGEGEQLRRHEIPQRNPCVQKQVSCVRTAVLAFIVLRLSDRDCHLRCALCARAVQRGRDQLAGTVHDRLVRCVVSVSPGNPPGPLVRPGGQIVECSPDVLDVFYILPALDLHRREGDLPRRDQERETHVGQDGAVRRWPGTGREGTGAKHPSGQRVAESGTPAQPAIPPRPHAPAWERTRPASFVLTVACSFATLVSIHTLTTGIFSSALPVWDFTPQVIPAFTPADRA